MENGRSKHTVDILRVFAMFLVLCCHWPYPGLPGGLLIVFSKTAVPFFMIVSGYFCYHADDNVFARRILKQLTRMFLLMIWANVMYGYLDYRMSGFATLGAYFNSEFIMQSMPLEYFIKYNQSPFADHLWFLGSMVYVLAFLWILAKCKIHPYAFLLAPVLSIVYIILGRNTSIDFICVRNALLCTLPYLMYGCLIHKYEEKIYSKLNYGILILLILAFGTFSVWEYFHVETLGIVYVSTELLALSIALFALKGSGIRVPFLERLGRKDMLFVYIVHMAIMYSMWEMIGEIKWPSFSYRLGAFFVFVVTIVLAEIWNVIKFLLIRLWKNVMEKN